MPAGFLLAEDAAVKNRFSSMTVSDDRNGTRPVKVFFRYPESETEKDYPFITIENIGVSHARNLQHSLSYMYYKPDTTEDGANTLNYWPSELTREGVAAEVTLDTVRASEFVPVYLVYQVATYARSVLHDRQMTSKMLKYFTPFRVGTILVPEDGTARRFDLLGWTNSDLLDQETGYRKRVFRKIYTIQMTAELPSSELTQLHNVSTVVGTLQEHYDPEYSALYAPFSEVF